MKIKEKDEYSYYEELKLKTETLKGIEKQLALKTIAAIEAPYYSKYHYHRKIERLLNVYNKGVFLINPMSDNRKPLVGKNPGDIKEFCKPLVGVVTRLLGKYPGNILRYIVNHRLEYPYSVGYYRRPFRTTSIKYHIPTIIDRLTSIIELSRHEYSITDYLTNPDYPVYSGVISDIIAYEVDNNNQEVIKALKDIVYGDNNTALLSTTIIKGMCLSHSQEVYDMLGQLLISARLQEGLRQSIVESMDEGTMEATLYIFKIIMENDFVRYSSVVRALNVWTGLGLEGANTRVVKQCIEYAYNALRDEELCLEWLRSDNPHKVYMALWAIAMREEEDLYRKINYLMERGKLYQKITAQYLLAQSQNEELRFNIAQKHLDESDIELQYWVITNYVYQCQYLYGANPLEPEKITMEIQKTPTLLDKIQRHKQFKQLKSMASDMPQKGYHFQSTIFEWIKINYSLDMIVRKMMYIAAYDKDNGLIEQILEFSNFVSPSVRGELIEFFVKPRASKIQREFLFSSLSDKSSTNREKALNRIEPKDLISKEIEMIEGMLSLKTGSLRQSAIKLLLGINRKQLEVSIDRLISSDNELQRLGALEILTEIREDNKFSREYIHIESKLDYIEQPTDKERILIDKLREHNDSISNCFGLVDQLGTNSLRDPIAYHGFSIRDLFITPQEDIKNFVQGLSQLVHQHREYQYEVQWSWGDKQTFLVGANLYPFTGSVKEDNNSKTIDSYPLSEIWSKYLESTDITLQQLLEIAFYCNFFEFYRYYFNKLELWEKNLFKPLTGWRKEIIDRMYPMEKVKNICEFLGELPYKEHVITLVSAYLEGWDMKEVFSTTIRALNTLIYLIPQEKYEGEEGIMISITEPWLSWSDKFTYDDYSFEEYFTSKYKLYAMNKFQWFIPDIEEFARANSLGLIDNNEIFRELMEREQRSMNISAVTDPVGTLAKEYPGMKKIRNTVIGKILEIEGKRGDLPTEVTNLAMAIQYYEGMEYFIKILTGLDKEGFVRGYIYNYGNNMTKKETFSHLLRVCHPKEGEDEDLLGQLLAGQNISQQRLLEAAMYAPQWIEIISKHLNWQGLKSGAWYFHAHINETFPLEKETIVARYSPISPDDFKDGAFDVNWFKEAYSQLGEERFNILYDCAKYISGGANHRRAQLFADATLGKLKLADIKKSVESKRNKDHLLVYSLIPIDNNNPKDILDRYEFIQRFLKDSKGFGSQRRASEAKAAAIALDNLARNGGYKDVIRLTWKMESQKTKEVSQYLQPKEIEDIVVQLYIDKEGRSEIKATKNDKQLKSVPSKYNKHQYILEIKEVRDSLKAQYSRAKAELEKSMETESTFTLGEIVNLIDNPVISPLIVNLVLRVKNHLGYFKGGFLEDAGGNRYQISTEDEILIAHPIHLYESGKWSQFQKDIFHRRVKQPFKQLFRELYIPNQDELSEGTLSRRYAGHQVQPRKSVALLKNHGWTANFEEGLQKVYYKDNIIAKVHTQFNSFTPADVESPTLEGIEFINRHSYENIELSKIPKIIFSEVMRDLDLVVSIAHVGGVDPEASLSTIDMRRVIVQESLRLMDIKNVRLEGNFVHISGMLGEYAVHLGSAMAYKQAKGALSIIPVHSQHRGRIFLPFMDEDPRTAEVVSKVILLAQDTKIKDPYILEQLKG